MNSAPDFLPPPSHHDELSLYDEWAALAASPIDAARELQAVVHSHNLLRFEPSCGATADQLVELHAALLLYQLAGRVVLLPATGFAQFGLRSLERHVVRAASRLAGPARDPEAAFSAWRRSGRRIEQLVGLVDPELNLLVA